MAVTGAGPAGGNPVVRRRPIRQAGLAGNPAGRSVRAGADGGGALEIHDDGEVLGLLGHAVEEAAPAVDPDAVVEAAMLAAYATAAAVLAAPRAVA